MTIITLIFVTGHMVVVGIYNCLLLLPILYFFTFNQAPYQVLFFFF